VKIRTLTPSPAHVPTALIRRGIALLPAAITRAASARTYQIIGTLVDSGRTQNAYRAYAYFRWVDDQIDGSAWEQAQRLAFVARQQAVVASAYAGRPLHPLAPEEQMAVDLIASDPAPDSGLGLYIRHMMAVMVFDAERRGRLITQAELDAYTRDLAIAVTEALHYFIGHDDPSPQIETRYHAVIAAHITHMLRDTCDDLSAGYFNIPREALDAGGITPFDVHSDAYRAWVQSRVQLAREMFRAGRDYLAQVPNARCRMAGEAYCAQFEAELDLLERHAYVVRSDERQERI
jgi:hypothetical protein